MPDENGNQPAATQGTPAPSSGDQVGLRVSLIPAEETERQDPAKGFRRFLTTVIIFVVLIGGIIGGLWFWVNLDIQAVAKLDAQTADYAKQSKDLAPSVKNAKNTQTRLRSLAKILPKHKTGLNLLTFLDNYTLPNVGYSSLSAGSDGSVTLMASAATFEAYAAQIIEFHSRSEIKNLVATNPIPTYDDKNNLLKVDFSLSITFDPSIFLSQAPTK
jgi:hypothetical protein